MSAIGIAHELGPKLLEAALIGVQHLRRILSSGSRSERVIGGH
jgi:hypothetical protein